MKHTPGPWHVQAITDGRNIRDSSNRGVARAGEYYGRSSDLNIKKDEAEANKHLIAAAPELLEALERIVNDSMHKVHPIASQMALAAINKAIGEK